MSFQQLNKTIRLYRHVESMRKWEMFTMFESNGELLHTENLRIRFNSSRIIRTTMYSLYKSCSIISLASYFKCNTWTLPRLIAKEAYGRRVSTDTGKMLRQRIHVQENNWKTRCFYTALIVSKKGAINSSQSILFHLHFLLRTRWFWNDHPPLHHVQTMPKSKGHLGFYISKKMHYFSS
jgi:hypothetical protein